MTAKQKRTLRLSFTGLLVSLLIGAGILWSGVFQTDTADAVPPGYIQGPSGVMIPQSRMVPATKDGPDLYPEPMEFGTAHGNDHWIAQHGFVPQQSSTSYSVNNFYFVRNGAGGDSFFGAPLRLPEGANLVGIRYYFRDNSASNDVTFWLCVIYTDPDGGPLSDCPFVSNSSGFSGDDDVFVNMNITIDHRQDYNGDGDEDDVAYIVYFGIPSTDSSQGFRGIRAFYYRQMSPAPATQSFNDVPPTHMFFQAVEALAASGITSGCGGGNYCPNQYVTRGQMAAFLARALGLHWSPFYP